MYTLIDRSSGAELATISEADLQALQTVLVPESEADADYYVTRGLLEALLQQGLSEETGRLLDGVLSERGDLDIGWEPSCEQPVATVSGRALSGSDPLPGLRCELTLDDGQGTEICWCFSRPDGSFRLALDSAAVEACAQIPLLMTLMALGDHPLVDIEVADLTEAAALGDIDLPCIRGRLTAAGAELGRVLVDATLIDLSVEPALEYSTWTLTEADGSFRFPYPPVDSSRPQDSRLELDLTAVSGEPLETILRIGPLSNPDLGDCPIAAPNPQWQPSEEARESLEQPGDLLYPGVSPHPLH